jgi:hypothetical protein
MYDLSADCLDRWQADFGTFRYAFLRYCTMMAKACGYSFSFDQDALAIAHANWRGQCQLWEKTRMMPNSHGLSHVKILAILLYQLSCVEWVTDLYEFDSSRDGIEFNGTNDEREETRKDINGGRGTYLAFQFAVQVIGWFEKARIDRLQDFEFRLTTALEHDMMVYLLSEKREETAVYLILHALFTRDPA